MEAPAPSSEQHSFSTYCVQALQHTPVLDSEHTRAHTHTHTHTHTVWRANSDEVNSTTILQAREESDNPNTTGQRREAAESARALPDGREMPPWMPAALPDCPGTSSTQSQPPLPPGQPRRLGS